MISTFFLVVITVVLVIGLWFFIPTLIQIRSTAKKVEEFVDKAENMLIPLAEEIRDTNKELKIKLNSIDHLVNKIDDGIDPFVDISKAVKPIAYLFKLKPLSYLYDITAVAAGCKKGFNTLLNYFTKGGEKDESS